MISMIFQVVAVTNIISEVHSPFLSTIEISFIQRLQHYRQTQLSDLCVRQKPSDLLFNILYTIVQLVVSVAFITLKYR